MNNYIKPTTTTIKVELQQMIANSEPMSITNETTTTLDAKGGFLWDEDDDDDPMGAPTFNVWEE